MQKKAAQKLLAKIEMMEREIQDLKQLAVKVLAQKEWYSTAEVAAKLGITQKTAANYCHNGRFSNTRKRNGRLEIHKSELNR
jgi:DNA-binding CsgD family transcriptional regulator